MPTSGDEEPGHRGNFCYYRSWFPQPGDEGRSLRSLRQRAGLHQEPHQHLLRFPRAWCSALRFHLSVLPDLREKVIKCLEKTDITFHKHGVYVCTEGPRFESAAEIKMFAMMGGDLVGMTNMPESILAREAEMCYTNCSIVTNMAAGISPTPLSHKEVCDVYGTQH